MLFAEEAPFIPGHRARIMTGTAGKTRVKVLMASGGKYGRLLLHTNSRLGSQYLANSDVSIPAVSGFSSGVKHALIFDLDGTLVESLPGIADSLNRALELHGLPGHGYAAVRGFIGDGAKMLVTRALAPGEAAIHLESVLRSFSEDYAISWSHGTRSYTGIQELLAELSSRDIPMAVLSNKPHPFTVEIVGKLFPENTFAAVLGNREGLPHKPDPSGALEIANSLGLSPENCTLIGDSSMDLDTARSAGMKSIAVTWGYHDRERLSSADRIVDSVSALAVELI